MRVTHLHWHYDGKDLMATSRGCKKDRPRSGLSEYRAQHLSGGEIHLAVHFKEA